MRISENKIEEIRQSADIVDLISGYVSLKKRGKNYIGLCPFHQEKTPSFTVSPDKQIYHCFGCHAGGNIFSFLMEFKSISFVEAAQELAGQYGIIIGEEDSETSERNNYIEELYSINLAAAKYFSGILFNSGDGKPAADYLKKRGINLKIQKSFGLGYAKPGWNNFYGYASANNIDPVKAKELGLLDKKEGGDYYDKFRDRVIFPIFSTNGRVIAFGGRILSQNENTAKYLNSPESQVYSKRKVLYGLYHSKDEIRKLDLAYLVEGYMDLISLHQAGVKNVVASSGTALTEEQVVLLSRFTKNLLVLFDADKAGQNAALKSIELLLKHNFTVKIMSLPQGEDPDSFINRFGREAFEEQSKKALDFLEYQVKRFNDDGALADPVRAAEAVRDIVKKIALINDPLQRDFYIKSLGKKFNLREKMLEKETDKYLAGQNQNRNIQAPAPPMPPEEEIYYPEMGEPSVTPGPPPEKKDKSTWLLEKDVIGLLLEGDEEITGMIFDNFLPDDFRNGRLGNAAQVIYDCYLEDVVHPSSIFEKIEEKDLKDYLFKMVLTEYEISQKRWTDITDPAAVKKEKKKFAKDIVKKIQIKQLENRIETLTREITEVEALKGEIDAAESDEKLIKLMIEKKELEDERKILRNELKGNPA